MLLGLLSLFQYVLPFIATSAAIPLLHERLTWELLMGGVLILCRVFIATTITQKKKLRLSIHVL